MSVLRLFIMIGLFVSFSSVFADASDDLEENQEIEEDQWISAYEKGRHLEREAINSPDYKVCIIGDPGTGYAAQYRVAKAIAKEKCDQIRVVGDLIYELGLLGVDDPRLKMQFYRPNYRLFHRKHKPEFFMALGNHDYFGRADAWIEVAKQDKQVNFPSRYYSDSWGDICFFTLDTTPIHKEKDSLEGQVEWLKNSMLNQQQTCKFSIALGHHTYRSVGKHGNAEGMVKQVLEETVIGKVDLYVAGHDHNLSDEGLVEDTHLLVSGSAGKRRRLYSDVAAGNWALSANGYTVLTFHRNGDGSIRGHYRFTKINKIKHAKWKVWRWLYNYYRRTDVREGDIVGRGLRLPDAF